MFFKSISSVACVLVLWCLPLRAEAQTTRQLAEHPAFLPLVQACESLRRYEVTRAVIEPGVGGVRPDVIGRCRQRDLRALLAATSTDEEIGALLLQAELVERAVSALRECDASPAAAAPPVVSVAPTPPAPPAPPRGVRRRVPVRGRAPVRVVNAPVRAPVTPSPPEPAPALSSAEPPSETQAWCASDRTAPAPASPRVGGADGALGVDWTTKFAEALLTGLAQHLATRARAELQQSLLADVRQRLCAVEPQRSLLASTCAVLGTGDEGPFGAAFGRTFTEALTRDATQLPRHVAGLLDRCQPPTMSVCPDAPAWPRSGAQLRLRLALEVMASLTETTDVPTLARNLTRVSNGWRCAERDEDCATTRALTERAFELLELVARREVNPSALTYLALDAMREAAVLARPPATTPAPGRAVTPSRAGGAPVASAPTTPADALRAVSEQRAVAALNQLATAVANLKTVMDRLQAPSAASAPTSAPGAAPELDARTQRVADAAHGILQVVNAALAFPGQVNPESAVSFRVPTELAELAVAVASGAVPRLLVMTLRILRELVATTPERERFEVPADSVRLLSFGAELLSARTTEEAASAMDSFLAPVGGWRAKGQRRLTTSLTGFVGVTAGAEWTVFGAGPGFRGGLFAPAGVELVGRVGGGWSVGLYVPVIDLGALLPYSYNEGTSSLGTQGNVVTQIRDFDPLRLVAPGAYFRVGIARTPLVWGLGATYQPGAYNLTQGTGATATSQREGALLVQSFLAVDVTFWTF